MIFVVHNLADELSDRQTSSQSRRFDACHMNDSRIVAIAADQEVCERLFRRIQLRPDAAARQPQIGDGQAGTQLLRRFDEVLERYAVVLVVVLASPRLAGVSSAYSPRQG